MEAGGDEEGLGGEGRRGSRKEGRSERKGENQEQSTKQ